MIAAAILAAGASSRMGRPKALLDWHGETFLEAMVGALREAGIPERSVVVGGDGDAVGAEAARLGLTVLSNPEYRAGRGTSIRTAARWAEGRSASLVVWPVDCPAVSPETLRALAVAAAQHRTSNVVPVLEERGGHPVLLCRECSRGLRDAEDDVNLRHYLRTCGVETLRLPVEDPAVLDNVDTPVDYRRFLHARPRTGAEREEHERA